MSGKTGQGPPGTQAIGRALAVLKLLASSERETTAGAIASSLGLSSGTTSRILRALVAEGLLTRNVKTDSYYLGSAAVLLGQAAQRSFGLDQALPVLEQIGLQTRESVNLVVREGAESVVMIRVQSTLPLRFEQHAGARFPLYSTASGKAILSFASDAETYLKSLPKTLPALTPHTLRTPGQLRAHLEATRRRGYSTDHEENVDGVRCVGAAVRSAAGQPQAALVIQVPSVRMPPRRMVELGERVADGAKEVARFIPVDRHLPR